MTEVEQKRENLVHDLRALRDTIASITAYNSRLPSLASTQNVFHYLQQADADVYRALNSIHVEFPDTAATNEPRP